MIRHRLPFLRSTMAGSLLLWTLVSSLAAAQDLQLMRVAPVEAYVVIHGRHNPERDYQRVYWEEAWETARQARLGERLMEILAPHIAEKDRERATQALEELQQALQPLDTKAFLNAQEILYAGLFEIPMHHSLLCIRTTPEATRGGLEAVRNLMQLAERASDGDLRAVSTTEGDAEMMRLELPAGAPVRPAAASVDDVLVLSTSEDLVRATVRRLQAETSESKFDDPRIRTALEKLPPPEDTVVVFDGRKYFENMGQLPEFIRQHQADNDDARRATHLLEEIIQQVSIVDLVVDVEYTDQFRNIKREYGRLADGAEERVLYKMLASGQPFDDWSHFVPAESTGFSLSTGVSLHPLYQWITEYVPGEFPKFQEEVLDKLQAAEEQYDVYLDRDILQNFPGPVVTVQLPPQGGGLSARQQSVTLLQCNDPERIEQLVDRAVEQLQAIPALKMQQIRLVESKDLDGFRELSAVVLALAGVRPTIGFRDQWMIIGSSPQAVQRVLETRSNPAETFADSQAFARFQVDVDGPVTSIRYRNLGEQIRGFAQLLQQAGMIVPMIVAGAGAEQNAPAMQTVGQLLGLLPAIGQVVAKFDFYESSLAVAQPGSEPGTWTKETVVLIRPPGARGAETDKADEGETSGEADNAAEKDAAEKDAAEKDAAEKDAAEKDAAEKDAAEKDAEKSDQADQGAGGAGQQP